MLYRSVAVTTLAALLHAFPMHALSIAQFRKFTQDQQAVFMSGAISMLAYYYAADGDVPRATCVKTWHLRSGNESAREIAIEVTVAERKDPHKLQIEGVLLGVAERVCPASKR